MAIRGIDTQIMITRSADLARDVGAMAKRPELSQEQMGELQKIAVAHDLKKVQETAEAEMDKLRTDKDGSNGASGGDGGGGGAETSEEGKEGGVERTMLVPASDNVIDITI
ncbi:MAG: hypothetical protein FWB97_02220 [Oscillospiraceae bacterium]|nr:hypothetical protein [Oscillospiraceae bacterium]